MHLPDRCRAERLISKFTVYLIDALSVAIKMRDAEAQKRGNDIINNAVDYINEHYADEDISLDALLFNDKGETRISEDCYKKVQATAKVWLHKTPSLSNSFGKALGKEDKASALVEEMKTCFADIAAKSEGDGTKTVYFEVSPLQYGLWTAGKGTFMNEIAEMIGLKNCFDDVEGWASISEEQVLERNPDYIVTITMYFGEGPTPTEELLARPGWENVTAIKNAAILNLVDNELSRPSPRLMQGAQMMYDFVYGSAEENAA